MTEDRVDRLARRLARSEPQIYQRTGDALDVQGTPSALLLDAEGRIASGLAVGVDQVLALAGALREAMPVVVQTPTSA